LIKARRAAPQTRIIMVPGSTGLELLCGSCRPEATRAAPPKYHFPTSVAACHGPRWRGPNQKEEAKMARSKPTAIEALAKLREQREALDQRERQLRGEAAGELGKLLLECGAESLEPAKLRQLMRHTTTIGIDGALARLASA
jgi:Family of unknown function (DUF6437)